MYDRENLASGILRGVVLHLDFQQEVEGEDNIKDDLKEVTLKGKHTRSHKLERHQRGAQEEMPVAIDSKDYLKYRQRYPRVT